MRIISTIIIFYGAMLLPFKNCPMNVLISSLLKFETEAIRVSSLNIHEQVIPSLQLSRETVYIYGLTKTKKFAAKNPDSFWLKLSLFPLPSGADVILTRRFLILH